MLTSIRKFSKSIFAKIFIAIIALPFVLWGMGDIFSSGKQNVIAEINQKKISSKEFINYIQKISITKKEMDTIGKDKFFEDLLTNYISEKIISIEGEKKGVELSDVGLKKILIGDKNFQKNEKFSRVKYEKFLLENGYSAPSYEKYIRNIELKGQLLSYYSGGIKLPEFIIDDLYKKENQIKEVEYLDLSKIYSNKNIGEDEIKDFYNKNKNFFEEKFISFKYLELTPAVLIKNNEFNEEYYEKLEDVENQILDGIKFNDLTRGNSENVVKIKLVNSRKTHEDGSIIKDINNELFEKIFLIDKVNIPQFISLKNKFYITEVTENKNITLTLNDKDLRKTIKSQILIGYKINENKKIIEKINDKTFNKEKMIEISRNKNIQIIKNKINGLNDKKYFGLQMLKKIYEHNKGEIFVITDTNFDKNYLIRISDEADPKINKDTEEYKRYSRISNVKYISKVYKSYDKYINTNYKIDINQKVLERLKNSF